MKKRYLIIIFCFLLTINFVGGVNNITTCSIISTQGSYELNNGLIGAPHSASPIDGTTCMKIISSDVDFNCKNYGISGNTTIYNNSSIFGIQLNQSVTNVTVRNCTNITKYSTGIRVANSNNSNFINNKIYDGMHSGFLLRSGINNTIKNNIVYNNSNGFILTFVSYTTIEDNIVYNNSKNGFFLSQNKESILKNNTVYQNMQNGIYIHNSNETKLNFDHLYSNNFDLAVNNTATYPSNITLNSVYFDNYLGNFTDGYTNLSLTDDVLINTSYYLDWANQPDNLPENYTSFRQKFINMQPTRGNLSLKNITWHWIQSEITPQYNESKFELFRYQFIPNASTWYQMNNTPDTIGNTLSLSNLSLSGIFAILQKN